jgi:hypothetical protein
LGDETIPLVSEPPGNFAEFQAHAVSHLLRIEKPPWFFNALEYEINMIGLRAGAALRYHVVQSK